MGSERAVLLGMGRSSHHWCGEAPHSGQARAIRTAGRMIIPREKNYH